LRKACPLLEKKRIGNLLDAVVDRLDDRDTREPALADLHQALPNHIGREHTGQQQNHEGQEHTEPRDVEAEPGPRVPGLRQQQQSAVHHADDEIEHPECNDQRDPNEEPCDEIFLHPSAATLGY